MRYITSLARRLDAIPLMYRARGVFTIMHDKFNDDCRSKMDRADILALHVLPDSTSYDVQFIPARLMTAVGIVLS